MGSTPPGTGSTRDREYRDAAAVFRVIVLCEPTEERGYLALGSCHEGTGQEGVALEIYRAATMAARPAPRCHVARGRLLRLEGRDEEAGAALDEASAIADALDDDQLRALVACERGWP